MEIIYKKVEDVIPYDKNPRKNDEAVKYVANSIKEFGFKVPIIIDKNGVIVAGHTRLKAARRLGLTDVPCVVADDLSDEQLRAFRIADNKVAEMAEWDEELLSEELAEILDIDMEDFGFDFDDEDEDSDLVEDDVPEVKEVEPVAKPGDIWQLGRHRLMCGDSTSKNDVEKNKR